jgi:hypothetical protein
VVVLGGSGGREIHAAAAAHRANSMDWKHTHRPKRKLHLRPTMFPL